MKTWEMKKLLVIFISLLVYITQGAYIRASQPEKLAIFPVNVPSSGSSLNIFPNTLNLVSTDIANLLSKNHVVSVLDINASEDSIRAMGLIKDYRKLLADFKNTYSIDYDTCALIARKLGVNKILFVSGGFDIQESILKRGRFYNMDIPGASPLAPSYRLNILVSLVDPQSGIIIWENTYGKDFNVSNFPIPSQYFGENIISVKKIKKYSQDLADKVCVKLAEIFVQSEVTSVNSSVVSTSNRVINDQLPRDGIMTRDGHSYSTNTDYLLINRKNKFKNWIKNTFSE